MTNFIRESDLFGEHGPEIAALHTPLKGGQDFDRVSAELSRFHGGLKASALDQEDDGTSHVVQFEKSRE